MPFQYNFDTITSEDYKSSKNFMITFGITETKFGQCLIGIHNEKICYLSFFDKGDDKSAMNTFKSDWPNSQFTQDNSIIGQLADKIFHNTIKETGDTKSTSKKELETDPLNILLCGTEMQCKIWMHLTTLQEGTTASYEDIAIAIGSPRGARAVANAIGRNRIAYLLPCHRVVPKSGGMGKYRWGVARKTKMLDSEGVVNADGK